MAMRTEQHPFRVTARAQARAGAQARAQTGTGARTFHQASADAETSAQPWALSSGLPPALPGSRVLRCAAGFHRDERAARELAAGLRHDLGLSAAQITLLRPRDAEPGRYSMLARRWAAPAAPAAAAAAGAPGRAWAAGLVAVGGVGMPSLLVAASRLAPAGGAADGLPLALTGWAWGWPMALLACLMLFALIVTLAATPRPPGRRFDRALQRALRRGDWAVVVHDLPAALQADVATALRHNSRCWCAQAPRRTA